MVEGWGSKMLAAVSAVAELAAEGFGLPHTAFTDLMAYGPHLLAPTGAPLSLLLPSCVRIGEALQGISRTCEVPRRHSMYVFRCSVCVDVICPLRICRRRPGEARAGGQGHRGLPQRPQFPDDPRQGTMRVAVKLR